MDSFPTTFPCTFAPTYRTHFFGPERLKPGISFHIYAALAQTAAEFTETGADLKRRWRELRFLDTESLVEYFDRAQDLAILLQERGITYDSEDIAMDVLQGLRERTDKANASFYTTLALAECSSLVDLRRRARNLHRVMPTAFTAQISLTTLERARGEESVRRMDTGPNPGINVTLLQSFACGAKTRWFSECVSTHGSLMQSQKKIGTRYHT